LRAEPGGGTKAQDFVSEWVKYETHYGMMIAILLPGLRHFQAYRIGSDVFEQASGTRRLVDAVHKR